MTIVSLRDAEIELARMRLEIDKLKRPTVVAPTVTPKVNTFKQFQPNSLSVTVVSSSSGGSSNIPNTIPPTPVKEVIYDTSSTLAGLPTGLGIEDTGQQYYNSYFKRFWFWDGTGWNYLDAGVPAGGQISTSGFTPTGGLWVACDGNSYNCADNDAVIRSHTASPAQASGGNNPIIQGGAGDTTQHGATAPMLNLSVAIGIGSLSVNSATGTGTALTGTGAIAGGSHSHGLSGSPSVTQQPTINAPTDAIGTGLRISMAWWMRR